MKCVFPQKLFLDAISLIRLPLKTKMLPFLGCYMKNQKMHVKFFERCNRGSIKKQKNFRIHKKKIFAKCVSDESFVSRIHSFKLLKLHKKKATQFVKWTKRFNT